MAAAPGCTTDFLELIVKSGLIDEAGLDSLGDLPDDPTSCAAMLINKGVLTKFQAKLLLSGRYKGFKLGAYFIREQIGQGGMGAVYLAEHQTLRRKVALKVLTLAKDGNAALSVERFLREARSAAALDHANIVRLHDVGKSGDTHFLVMEYVEGNTLEQIISKGGPISPARAVEYIAQAAAGLQHACEKGFIHRDIKPANLMLTRDGTIKILDMGLARPTDENADKLTEVMDKGAIVGTADFISPEQAMNGHLDVRSDIYSLGATFFSLVTGQPPFNGNTTQKLIQHQMKEAPSVTAIDKTFPAGLSQIVSKMLAKKPEQRYQTPADVIKALAEWLPQEASGRIAAAITGTDLAHGGELTATLTEIANGTRRITKTKLAVQKKRDWFWPGVAAAVLVVAGCIAAVISLSLPDPEWKPNEIPTDGPPPELRKDPAPKKAAPPPKAPTPKAEPKRASEPKRDPEHVPVVVPLPTAPSLLALDLSMQKPFVTQGRMVAKPETTEKVWSTDTSTGPGQMPKDWKCSAFRNINAVAEFCSKIVDGQPALGMRNVSTPSTTSAGAILLSPRFDTAGKIRIAFECKFEQADGNLQLKFLQQKPATRAAFEFHKVQAAKDAGWKSVTCEFDPKTATAGLVEFLPSGEGYVWIRNFRATRSENIIETTSRDQPLYKVDFAAMKPCSQKYDKYPKTFSVRTLEGQSLPGNLSINQHRPNVSSEYCVAEIDGRKAFGLRMLDAEIGVQIQTNCNDTLTLLKPDDSVTISVVYRFDGTGNGNMGFQNSSPSAGYTKYGMTALTPTGGEWKTITSSFLRPAAEARYDFILNSGGIMTDKPRAEGMIYIESMELKFTAAK